MAEPMRARPQQAPKRVLVTTSVQNLIPALAAAHAARGEDAVFGCENFLHACPSADEVHIHWPEEILGWRAPAAGDVDRAIAALGRWRAKARIVATVHNLPPHRGWTPEDRRWFAAVYGAAEVIGHFSRHSRERLVQEFPDLADKHHIVHVPHRFELPLADRAAARARFAIPEGCFAVLSLGALRRPGELSLTLNAMRHFGQRRKFLLLCSRYLRRGGGLGSKLRHMAAALEVQATAMVIPLRRDQRDIPDGEVPALMAAADAILIPREPPQLNSGLMPLAMEHGTPVVAPDFGPFAEHLRGTSNELFTPGDAKSCAAALARLSARDRNAIARQNRGIASRWGWPAILDAQNGALA